MDAGLKHKIDNGEIGFEDIFEAYAQLCINSVRDITQDMILDEGVAKLLENDIDLTTTGLTQQAVDWARYIAPEMLGDVIPDDLVKLGTESWFEYVARAFVVKRVKETKAFQIKFS